MAHSRIIEELVGRDPARVRADLDAIRREREALDAEEALLNQVLSIQAMRNGRSEPSATDSDVSIPRTRKRREGPSVSGTVLDVMRANAGRWLDYDSVYSELERKGFKATRNAMRVALNRWAERGELEQDNLGRFRYPLAPQAAVTPDEGVLDT